MKHIRNHIIVAAAALCGLSPVAFGQLGVTLTPFGAEKAGNAAGTIPPYTGGIKAPADYKPSGSDRPDPFADEKPLYTVTADNLADYAAIVTPGTQAMLKQYPSSFKLNVYPTHRSVAYPDWVLDNTVKNATRCKTRGDNSDGLTGDGCRLGIAFPVPKTGQELMWNHKTRYQGVAYDSRTSNWLGSSNGNMTLGTDYKVYTDYPFYDQKTTNPKYYFRFLGNAMNPPREVGGANAAMYPMSFDTDDQLFYTYTTGQRRVRLAPEFSYDTPNASMGGVMFYDEVSFFSGRMDRFDFKISGKKEMLIPYNTFKLYNGGAPDVFDKFHAKSDAVRWELHRVWVVESTLKPGQRHAYSKRTFYFDEDTWGIVAYDAYDQGGALFRTCLGFVIPLYDATGGSYSVGQQIVSLPTKQWTMSSFVGKPGYLRPLSDRRPDSAITPESLAGAGVR